MQVSKLPRRSERLKVIAKTNKTSTSPARQFDQHAPHSNRANVSANYQHAASMPTSSITVWDCELIVVSPEQHKSNTKQVLPAIHWSGQPSKKCSVRFRFT